MNEIQGTWKLQKYLVTEDESHQVYEPFGQHPQGVISFTADARMYAFLMQQHRQPAAGLPTEAEAARLHNSMLAYAGTYTVADGKVSTSVDISWNESWTGTTQVRDVKVEGNTMTLSFQSFAMPTGKPALYQLIWAKV